MDNGAGSYLRYLSGDDNGLTEIIRDYNDGLVLYLNGITGNFCLAEELAEETFFKLAVKKPRFSGKSSFKTWLYSIGRNAAIDGMRRKKHISDRTVDDLYDISDERSIEQDYLREEQKISLHRAMETLNSDYRQVLYLTFFEELSNSEAAAIMRKSNRQIENLLYRAKLALRSKLEKEGFEYERL
ncbi:MULTISPECIES: RNA polymerase sigma factor [Ruminococcus]|uniref:RNA polymerase sigma-70 factor (ECF subfamily) n=1 Tax=Ruminococcus flavefaciens TaxID=1265 RepID=A0A315XTR0_RUMFL|nr:MULTISPECIES: RNA polymerase sigma factor [Ruminococcus]MBQ6168405.1 RNA polymerase sigma factor [Ruminococcus sp.]MBR1431435.1 RNA polymerase sigma factor [Ruminococcus sp.]PWJ10240.1 RNA polymerase sigma-70 factor (ECF subfamily) [Ruminococcus flavefaciens]SSA51980.1 RNA polymerase sigma-70 factor, ECF subfamily [Ruminococcus flavefaciens]